MAVQIDAFLRKNLRLGKDTNFGMNKVMRMMGIASISTIVT